MRLVWASDVHFDFKGGAIGAPIAARRFAEEAKKQGDALLITGDIANGVCVIDCLTELSKVMTTYFVLGNHDYYGRSIEGVRREVSALCVARRPRLFWLEENISVQLSSKTTLVGVDGWYHAGYAQWNQFIMSDFYQISNLRSPSSREAVCHGLAAQSAERLAQQLVDAFDFGGDETKQIIIATHVPPFKEAARYRGGPSEPAAVPFFTSKATGDVLVAAAKTLTGRQLQMLVLCGHTHDRVLALHHGDCLTVRVAGAEYGDPRIEDVLEV